MWRPFIFTSLGVVMGESKRGNWKCGPENSRKRHDVTNMAPSEKPEVIQMLDYGVNRSLVTITDNGWSQK